jgi:predicted TPR repeat methyltransferase
VGRKGPDPEELVGRAQDHAAKGELVEAEALYGQALTAAPEHVGALAGLGVLLVERGKAEQAVELLERAREIAPGFAPVHSALCTAYADAGHDDQALAAAETSAKLETTSTIPLMQLARLHILAGRKLEAIGAVRRVLRRDPSHAQALYLRAGLSGDASFGIGAPPPELIADLFDRYARNFDQHLVEALKYSVPDKLPPLLGEPTGTWKVVDLGCGTGLAGVVLRPFAAELIGGDLSWKMLTRARARGIYDALYCEDLVTTVARVTEADLVVAADVLVYVGALEATFAATAQTLRSGGRFVFSVETHPTDDLILQMSLRYAHGDGYVRRLAAEHGFEVERADVVVVRMDANEPINGTIYVLRRG